MELLVAGLVLLLGIHSLTTFRWARARLVASIGLGPYKAVYSLAAGAGLVLIVLGFGQYRAAGLIPVWTPPVWTRHLTVTLMWFAFVALAAAYLPAGRIRGWLRHPMLVGVKIWALAHLLANGDLGGMVLFGAILLWAGFDRVQLKRRGDAGAPRLARFTAGDALSIAVGSLAYGAMIFLHPVLIGVRVIGN